MELVLPQGLRNLLLEPHRLLIGLLVFAVEQLDLPRLLEYRQELRVGRLLDLRGCLGVGQSALTKVSQVGHQAVAVEVGLALD